MIHGASLDGATATNNIAMEHRHGIKMDNITTPQSPIESDVYTLQDNDPLSLPSESLLPDHTHMVVQFIFAGLSLLLVPKIRPTKRPGLKDYILKVFPCALATSLDIGLSNFSLKTIILSFYTMLSDETEFEIVGFICVMTASVCGGMRWALTEVLLRKESMGLTNPFASIFFLAPAQVHFLFHFQKTGIILAGGCLAFCMIMAEFFLIKRTSVVTLSVCGIFKEVATIFISTLVFGDILTIINSIGLCITLFGIALYNWLKIQRATRQARKDGHEQELEDMLDNNDENEHHRHSREPMYSMVAESTPILMVDGAMTNYRDNVDSDSDDNLSINKNHTREQYELR
ncbi:hypothetical protein INT45_004869 [Circinella minor]|uniref:Sugar phosphate transporter domain-containing protein n=1 Tax=Circinella minor TaxID=1195481 RepID=A0A8H7RWZ8_9FUNG|nr:hypothetical protein INT45_004869 [Circinella minor]